MHYTQKIIRHDIEINLIILKVLEKIYPKKKGIPHERIWRGKELA